MSTLGRVEEILRGENFTRFGFARLREPFHWEFYEDWIEAGLHGDMTYLKEHAAFKKEPEKLLPRATSAIVVAVNYVPHPAPLEMPRTLPIALYALGEDYHFWLKNNLELVCQELRMEFPGEVFKAFVDSAPVLERDLAHRAGLGWIGKNTCLIDEKHGSLSFIGEIYSSLPLESPEVLAPDRCGTCTKCIDTCPTGAIVEPRKLDARKCLSYLTIEAKTDPEVSLRKNWDWFFGCDVCQTVCPWNQKAFKTKFEPAPVTRFDLIRDLRTILTESNRALERRFEGTPILRARASGLRRNALLLAVKHKAKELLPEIRNLKNSEAHEILATWCEKQLS